MRMSNECVSTYEWVSTWRRYGARPIRCSCLCALGGFKSGLFHCRCRRWGSNRTFGLNRHKNISLCDCDWSNRHSTVNFKTCMPNVHVFQAHVCVCTCGAGGLSIWGFRICKASSRAVCFFLNFPSGLLNISIQCEHHTLQFKECSITNVLYIQYFLCLCLWCKYNHSGAVCSLQAATSQVVSVGGLW